MACITVSYQSLVISIHTHDKHDTLWLRHSSVIVTCKTTSRNSRGTRGVTIIYN